MGHRKKKRERERKIDRAMRKNFVENGMGLSRQKCAEIKKEMTEISVCIYETVNKLRNDKNQNHRNVFLTLLKYPAAIYYFPVLKSSQDS